MPILSIEVTIKQANRIEPALRAKYANTPKAELFSVWANDQLAQEVHQYERRLKEKELADSIQPL